MLRKMMVFILLVHGPGCSFMGCRDHSVMKVAELFSIMGFRIIQRKNMVERMQDRNIKSGTSAPYTLRSGLEGAEPKL